MKRLRKLSLLLIPFTMLTNPSEAQQTVIKPTLNHISIYVKDLSASTAFYRDIIGLDTIPEPFHDGKHTWFAIGNGLQLHVIAGSEISPQRQRQTHTCYSVGSVDDFAAMLTKKEISYENTRGEKLSMTIRPDGFKQIYLQDPDGHWLEISDAKP